MAAWDLKLRASERFRGTKEAAHEDVNSGVEGAAEPGLAGWPEPHDRPPNGEERRGMVVHVQKRHLVTAISGYLPAYELPFHGITGHSCSLPSIRPACAHYAMKAKR